MGIRLEIDMPEHHYNNIMALDSVSLGRVPYKGIIMYAINAIKHGKVLDQEPTTKNNLAVREFEKIVVKYPPEDLCTYPEYKGKPYFGIQYRENGESIVGYGTYNPQILSRYLKDYFMPTTKNCKSCEHYGSHDEVCNYCYKCSLWIEQKPRKGHWIMTSDYFTGAYESIDYVKCSCCGEDSLEEGNYCPNCGAKMGEVEE